MNLLEKEIQEKKKKLAFSYQPNITYEKVLFENDFFTQNSIQIQEKLKTMDYHFNYVYCFQDYSTADIINVGKRINNSNKYVWMTFIKLKKIPLLQYLNKFTSSKCYISNLILTYEKLLSSLIQINKIGICYLNWNENNIFINEKEYPILSNFEYGINYSLDFSKEYWSKVMNKASKEFLPIEVYFLNEINRINENNKFNYQVLSSSVLEDIYIAMKDQSQTISNISYDEYISLFQIYINKTIEETIRSLCKFIPTWDNYSLSKFYLALLDKYIQSNPYDTKYPFIPKWNSLLKKNVSLNPTKRESLLKTQAEFTNFFSTF